jgi:hypothetical protein
MLRFGAIFLPQTQRAAGVVIRDQFARVNTRQEKPSEIILTDGGRGLLLFGILDEIPNV